MFATPDTREAFLSEPVEDLPIHNVTKRVNPFLVPFTTIDAGRPTYLPLSHTNVLPTEQTVELKRDCSLKDELSYLWQDLMNLSPEDHGLQSRRHFLESCLSDSDKCSLITCLSGCAAHLLSEWVGWEMVVQANCSK